MGRFEALGFSKHDLLQSVRRVARDLKVLLLFF